MPAKAPGPLDAFHKDFICDDVKFFLVFALNVVCSGKAENAGKSSVGHLIVDFFTQVCNRVEKIAKLLIDDAVA